MKLWNRTEAVENREKGLMAEYDLLLLVIFDKLCFKVSSFIEF